VPEQYRDNPAATACASTDAVVYMSSVMQRIARGDTSCIDEAHTRATNGSSGLVCVCLQASQSVLLLLLIKAARLYAPHPGYPGNTLGHYRKSFIRCATSARLARFLMTTSFGAHLHSAMAAVKLTVIK
jgi:hypothetical protein